MHEKSNLNENFLKLLNPDKSPPKEINNKKTFFQNLEINYPNKISYLYMFISVIFISLNAYCAKMLTGTETFTILFLRSLIMISILGVYCAKYEP